MKFEVDIQARRGGGYRVNVWAVGERAYEIAGGYHDTRTLWGARRWARKVSKAEARYRAAKNVTYTLDL